LRAKLRISLRKGDEAFECDCDVIGPETIWPRLAFRCYPAIPVNHIEPVGPAGIGFLYGITEIIDQGRKLYPQILHAGVGYGSSFFVGIRRSEYDLLLYVNRHLPDIAGVRLLDVDHVKRHLILVTLIEFVKGGNLPPEGRSRVTAEHEHDRFPAAERGQKYFLHRVPGLKLKIRRLVPDFQVSATRDIP